MVRDKLFWTLDLIKGKRVKKGYDEVKYILENLNSEEAKTLQRKRKKEILEHAISTTPFYRDRVVSSEFNMFPVINKNIIVDNYSDFKSSTYLNSENYSAYTSGSTGTPFKIYHDFNKKMRNSADVIYFSGLAGFKLGDKLFYIRHWDQYNSKTVFQAWKQNVYMHPVSKLSEREVSDFLNVILKSNKRKGILAYASALNEIRDYIIKYNLKPVKESGVYSIIAMAEALDLKTKNVLEHFFGVKVISRYSNVENGIIAQQTLGASDNYHINWASYFVEILKLNRDEPAEKGELGRIVVTDLFNYCMPMIRYDTGDIGKLDYVSPNSENHPVLMKIEGRKLDMIFDSSGNHISSYAVYNILKYPHIKQYQFIQEDDTNYLFKLNVDAQFNSEAPIKAEFQKLLGPKSNIKFVYVDEIPLLSSGKRKFVINQNRAPRREMLEY